MISFFLRAAGQLGDRTFVTVLIKSLALTLLTFAGAAALAGWLLSGLDPCRLASSTCRLGTSGGTAAALIASLLGLWFLFPAIAIAVIGLFSDEIVDAVEARYYPAARGRALPFGRSFSLSLRSAGRILLWNLLAAPFYLILLVTGVGPLLLFSAVNAIALGRDLGEMVAVRHLDGAELQRWLAETRLRRAALGLISTWLFLVPFANLLAPLVSAAAATHFFHNRGKR